MQFLIILNIVLIWCVLLGILRAVFVVAKHERKAKSRMPSGLPVGSIAPDFAAEDIDGRSITKSTYQGKQVMFVFIDHKCPSCIEKAMLLEELKQKSNFFGVEVVLVSTSKITDVKRMLATLNITLPVLISNEAAKSLAVQYNPSGVTPFICFISETGRVIFNDLGDGAKWENMIHRWGTMITTKAEPDTATNAMSHKVENKPKQNRISLPLDP